MWNVLRQRNFALLWTGGLISLLGSRVLRVVLPFYVYQQSGSTLATAIMVAAELIPHFVLGSIAGVFVDRADRKQVMLVTTLVQGGIILPLLWVQSEATLWLVYIVNFLQTTLAVFFAPAETALLPLLVAEKDLLPANALNALNNNLARLLGPPLGGVILAAFGLPGVVIFDSLTFVIAGGMILLVRPPVSTAPTPPPATASGHNWLARFWQEWKEGVNFIRAERLVAWIFVILVLLNFGGVMIDPLSAPFMAEVVGVDVQVYGMLVMVQAVGGISGGLLAGRAGQRWSAVSIFGFGTVAVGLMQLLRYNLPALPLVFATSLLIGLPAALAGAAIDTLFQQVVPNSHLGRVAGALNTSMSVVSLVGVLGIAGSLGEVLGIVPILNFAAVVTITAGVLGLVFLRAKAQIF